MSNPVGLPGRGTSRDSKLSTEPYLATPIAFIVFVSIVTTVVLSLTRNLGMEFYCVLYLSEGHNSVVSNRGFVKYD